MIGQVCPWGPWRLVVQLALWFAFLLLTVECLQWTDRAPSIMHRCSVIGASFDVNLAKFSAIVSDSNYAQPFHQGHFRIILFFMCILKYGNKFWATLPELQLIISFQQPTNALSLGSKVVFFSSFFFLPFLDVGNFKWGFYLMKLLIHEWNFLVSRLLLFCLVFWIVTEAIWLGDLPCVLFGPFLFIPLHCPTFIFVLDMIQTVASSCSFGKV